MVLFFFSSRRRHTRWTGDWSSDVCSSDLWRRCLAPGVEGRHTGQFVEAVIELHRIEVGKIKLEHFRGRELLGIERPAPVVVVPAGSANVDSGHITTPAERAGPTLRSCRTPCSPRELRCISTE